MIDPVDAEFGPVEEAETETAPEMTLEDIAQADNLAPLLDDSTVSAIGQHAKRQYERDCRSREDWMSAHEEAMDLALQAVQKKNYPFDDASNVIYPLITTAGIQFAARAYPAVVPGRNIVKCKVVGDDSGQFFVPTDEQGNPAGEPQPRVLPGAKATRAARVARWHNWQLLEDDSDWEPDTDALLHYLPIAGCAFRKRWWSRGPKSKFIPASRVVINMNAQSCETAPQITEEFQLYAHEIIAKARAGIYDKQKVEEKVKPDEDEAFDMLECHTRYDLDDDGYPEPYIITMTEDGCVFRIQQSFGDIKRSQDGGVAEVKPRTHYIKYDFIPNPDGFYGIGFGSLLGPINRAVNTSINQLNDAAHWQNAPSFLIGRGIRIKATDMRLRPNEMKPVDAFGTELKSEIYKVEAGQPSAVTFNLLNLMIQAGNDIASIKDILMGETNQNIAPTTALTLAEQGMKSFTAIFKRVHRALKKEISLLYEQNRENMDEIAEQYAAVLDGEGAEIQGDFEQNYDIAPVTDPDMVSDSVAMAKNQFLMQLAQSGMLNPAAVMQRVLETANVADPQELIPEQQGPSVDEQVKMMKVENDRMRVETSMQKAVAEIAELRAEALERRTQALKNIADAEAAESGMNMDQYRIELQATDRLMQVLNGARDGIGRVPGLAGQPGDESRPQGDGGPGGQPGILPQGDGLPQSANGRSPGGLPNGQGQSGGPAFAGRTPQR